MRAADPAARIETLCRKTVNATCSASFEFEPCRTSTADIAAPAACFPFRANPRSELEKQRFFRPAARMRDA
jgi:hypothetical protein